MCIKYRDQILIGITLFGGLLLYYVVPGLRTADTGGESMSNILLIGICCALLLLSFLCDTRQAKISRSMVLVITALLVDGGAVIFFASDIHSGFIRWIQLLFEVLIFYSSLHIVQTKKIAVVSLAYVLVGGSALLSLLSLPSFTQNLGYLHLESMLGEHNAFGGFLLLPLILSVCLALQAQGNARYVLSITSILIGVDFVLTLSRGAFASLFLALLISAILFYRHIPHILSKKLIARFLLIIVGITLISGGFMLYAKHLADKSQAALSVYGGRNVPVESTLARLYYFKDAVRIIEHNPLGIGLGEYEIEVIRTRDRVENFSFDAHNFYLRFTAETGIIGGLLLVSWLTLCLVPATRSLRKYPVSTKVGIFKDAHDIDKACVYGLYIGVIAVLIHAGMDVDFAYPLSFFTMLVSLGMLYGFTHDTTQEESLPVSQVLYMEKILLGVLVLINIFLLCVNISNSYAMQGILILNTGDTIGAISTYETAKQFDPWDYHEYLYEGQAYYTLALASTGDRKTRLLNLSLQEIHKALEYRKNSPKIYQGQSFIYEQLQDPVNTIGALEMAVRANPSDDFNWHVKLAKLYEENHEYAKAISFIDATTSKLPPSTFGLFIWSDPNKDQWKKDMISLLEVEVSIATLEKNPILIESAKSRIAAYTAPTQ